MRDLLNLLDNVLTESTGLAGRKPGDMWQNSQGQTLAFNNIVFYPEGGGVYDTAELEQFKQQFPAAHWVNNMPAKGGVGIATFNDEQGNAVLVGRYFQDIKPNKTDNKWKNGEIVPGFEFQSKASKKESSGYKPSDILTDLKSQTPTSLANQVIAAFGPNSDEARAITTFMQSNETPVRVPKGNMELTAFRDYMGEILQPIALVMGKKVDGNSKEAAQVFFGTPSYSDCVISFNDGVSGGLYDSLLVNSKGKQIKLSSKGESGAMASVVNFLRCIEELDATPQGRKLRAKHKEVIEIIDAIDQGGHFGGPLELASHYGIIDNDDVHFVPLLKNIGPTEQIDWGKHKKLQKLYNDRQANDPATMVPAEHMIAAIAYKVADHVNDNTNFSAAASEILNTSAFVQMYTYVKESGKNFEITFGAHWPSTAVTGVKLSAGKTYMSTAKGGGNMVFKILKGGAKDVPDAEETGGGKKSTAKVSTADLDQKDKEPRLTGPGAKASKRAQKPKMTKDVLGRDYKGK
jgi:hypothetical protein